MSTGTLKSRRLHVKKPIAVLCCRFPTPALVNQLKRVIMFDAKSDIDQNHGFTYKWNNIVGNKFVDNTIVKIYSFLIQQVHLSGWCYTSP